jgi:cyclic beta-1,2-glucan synthetase
MPQNTHLEMIGSDSQRLPELTPGVENLELLRAKARELATRLQTIPAPTSSHIFAERCKAVSAEFKPLLAALDSPPAETTGSDDLRWLYENVRLLHAELEITAGDLKRLTKVPQVRTADGEIVARISIIAEVFLAVTAYQFDEQKLTSFIKAFQETTVLELRELWALATTLKLLVLERIADLSFHFVHGRRTEAPGVGHCVRSLREIAQTTWKEVLDPLILFDRVLREDPAGCYAHMDFESRDLYRNKLSKISEHSEFSEMQVAWAALQLAREVAQHPPAEPRIASRRSHIGYYLVDDGVALLHERVGFRCPLGQRIRAKLRTAPNAWYLPGIAILTCAITAAVTCLLVDLGNSWGLFLLALLALLLPSSQTAVQLMNYLTISLLPPEILPKLDFSEGVPADCMTMVAIPSLLLSEEQVRGLVADLEVRFLGNHDPHMHFALLTDLPDSHEPTQEDSPLIDLCADLINELNEKYVGQQMGSFFLFHRHRTYNPREKAWMGWERKRGKLLDLNRLLRGEWDSFPVKVGDLRVLPRVRFVITLDSDTELPRGSAQRLVGTLAHPLNTAIIDPEKNIVVSGYGILQPRVGVSVQSTARSRLAAIYAGETGLDIYTRAVSDAYQDLYGEGIYTGKGIYEVETVHRIFHRRFPRNALLSHDLIEGAYARAGLVSDIEVIEDYPSHYSAYNLRKHRWLRGDWQIAGWMFLRVLNESGAKVRNPISIISRWKILDNLRRSLVEPATFLLLVLGWLVLPGGPGWWTLATICILFIPAWSEFVLKLFRAMFAHNATAGLEALAALYSAHVNVFFALTFLAHQTLVSLDAVIRALVRRLVTHCRLLEWETAAEIELGRRRPTPIDRYLEWMPALALALGIVILLVRPGALPAALPVLLLWGSSKVVSAWLNRSSLAIRGRLSRSDLVFLRRAAFHTWRYFAEFSTEEHNWLIPDNVQAQPPAIASRISPTNLGFLLNARQAACEFGYLTLPEFAELTVRTLATISALRKCRGHLFNWYDTRTLQPLSPLFVSSVDSGNLVASLWTLQQGCREQLREPLLRPSLFEGFVDCIRALENPGVFSGTQVRSRNWDRATDTWLDDLLALPKTDLEDVGNIGSKPDDLGQAQGVLKEADRRIQAIKQMVHCYAPWSLPEFAALRSIPGIHLKGMDNIPLECLADAIDVLTQRLVESVDRCISPEQQMLCERLRALLPEAQRNVARLVKDIRIIATEAGKLADEMDFAFLLNSQRKLMSVGFDAGEQQLHSGCYDLLGTESRTAVFVAIAKGDIPQQSWFRLGRAHTLDRGRPVILSWTGTLFEYLMPTLWMRSYPRTLLERSRLAAVRSQQAYAANKGVPWGISESAYSQLDEGGNYKYHAFGLPHLAQRKTSLKALVVSPYSTFLALLTDPSAAIRNLRRMAEMGWFGNYGFYESADYGSPRHKFWQRPYQLVRCWMAHHQGMSLLSLANFLKGNVVQRWFHSDRRVQATELLLQEKPVAHIRRKDLHRGTIAA